MSSIAGEGIATATEADAPLVPENFPMAIAAGLGAAIAAAVLWAMVTVFTEYEFGLMAIAVGFIVGYAIQIAGHGRTAKFRVLGAVCGLFGCVLGSLLSAIVVYTQVMTGGMHFTVLADAQVLPLMIEQYFAPMDLLFWAIGTYEGYKFAVKPQAAAPGR